MLTVGDNIGVRQHRAFRRAGGASGILQNRDIARRFDGVMLHPSGGGEQCAIGNVQAILRNRRDVLVAQHAIGKPFDERHRRGQRTDHNPPQPTFRRHRLHLAQNGGDIRRHHDLGAGIADLIEQFTLDIERIEIHHRAASPQHGEEEDHRIGRIRQTEPHLRATAHTEILQTFRRPIHQSAQLGIAPCAPQKIHRHAVCKPLHRPIKQGLHFHRLDHRLLRQV